jgi:hypothetical protein
MYDPQTSTLIRSVPAVAGLDPKRLPEDLTECYAIIASARLLASQQRGSTLAPVVHKLRRLATTYQSYAALHPRDSHTRAAAFVAGSSHQLLHEAESGDSAAASPPLSINGVSHSIASALLFLIAEQLADAGAVARRIPLPETPGVERDLVLCIRALAEANVSSIAEIPPRAASKVLGDDWDAAATSYLWHQLLEGVRALASAILGEDTGSQALAAFEGVQRAALTRVPLTAETDQHAYPEALLGFPGPYHLAVLLKAASESLLRSALTRVEPPTGCDEEGWRSELRRFARRRPFLWGNHLDAIAKGYLEPGTSSVLAFPTGAGKSTLSELKVATALLRGRDVVFLAPTHALVSQVIRDLRNAFPRTRVGDSLVEGGEYSEVELSPFAARDPSIGVMTPERCLTLASLSPDLFKACGLVIFDECHLLHPVRPDNLRRSLDATLSLLALADGAPEADIVLISAMAANAPELAEWLTKSLGRVAVPLDVTWKPTRQARGCVVYLTDDVNSARVRVAGVRQQGALDRPNRAALREAYATPHALVCLQQTWASAEEGNYRLLRLSQRPLPLGVNKWWGLTANRNEVAAELAAQLADAGVKTLIFAQSVVSAISAAERAASSIHSDGAQYTADDQPLLAAIRAELGNEVFAYLPVMGKAACHHALMLPEERELVEAVFRRDQNIRVLAATPTLAQGMNLPAEAVIMAGDDRFDGEEGMEMLDAHELLNAAGRAGRAGHMPQGMVLVVPGKVVDFDQSRLAVGERWHELRRDILSQGDQCLTIGDPLALVLDAIQGAEGVSEDDVRYFLNRLPRGEGGAAAALMRRSLSGFRAATAGAVADFEQKLARAVSYRAELEKGEAEDEPWVATMASQCGIDPAIVRSIGDDIDTLDLPAVGSIGGWLERVCGWAERNPEAFRLLSRTKSLEDSFSARLGLAKKDFVVSAESLALIAQAAIAPLVMWVSGSPLSDIETALGGKPKKHLEKARALALRFVPDFSYIVGLFALVARKRLALREAPDHMPLSLAVAASCLREGVDDPHKLAFRSLRRKSLSRVQAHVAFREGVAARLVPVAWNADFDAARAAVLAALDS